MDRVEVCVAYDYTLVVACPASDGGITVTERRGTIEDGEEQPVFTECGTEPKSAVNATVSVSLAQAGYVAMGERGRGGNSPLSAEFVVPHATYDLIASNRGYVTPEQSRLTVVRDIVVSGNRALGVIDLESSGRALTPVEVQVNGALVTDELSNETSLATRHGTDAVISSSSGTRAFLAPQDLVTNSDLQSLRVNAVTTATGANTHSILRNVQTAASSPSAVPVVDLPPIFDSAIFEDGVIPSASWTMLPTDDFEYVSFIAYGDSGTIHYVIATSSWLRKNEATRLGVDSSAPGASPTWEIEQLRGRSVSIIRTGVGSFSTGVSKSTN